VPLTLYCYAYCNIFLTDLLVAIYCGMKSDFNKLSAHYYITSTKYRFAKSPDDFAHGYNQLSSWVSELLYYCIRKERHCQEDLTREFTQLIEKKRNEIMQLEPSTYREGLLKALDDIRNELQR
jgi:hypothetical protein